MRHIDPSNVLLVSCSKKRLLKELEFRAMKIDSFWIINSIPDVGPGSRVYFVDKKEVRGSFKITRIERTAIGIAVHYNLDTWISWVHHLFKPLRKRSIVVKLDELKTL